MVKDDLKRMLSYHRQRRADRSSAPRTYEFRFIDKKGHIKDILLSIDIIPGTKRSVASLLDITESKQAEEALRQSEGKYRLLAENVTDVIFVQDMNLNITYASPSVTTLFGYSVEEALELKMEDILTPDSLRKAMDSFQEKAALVKRKEDTQLSPMEYECVRKDGSTFWGELEVVFLRDSRGYPVGVQGVLRNITDRKRAEEALRQSEKRFRELANLLPQSVFETDERGNLTLANRNAFDTFGYTKTTLTKV